MKKLLLIAIMLFNVVMLQAQCWSKISTGRDHTLGVRPDGTLWAWGGNVYGQLGTIVPLSNGVYRTSIPVQIGTANDWGSVSAGLWSSFAIKTNGTLWAWGENSYGGLGDGSFIDKPSPIQIGSSSWSSVSARDGYTVGIKSNGELWSWGHNNSGQLGNGTASATNFNLPVRVGTASNWMSISTGQFHCLAIKTNGTLWAWGGNFFGMLGDGTTDDHYSPIQIGNATNWASVSAGDYHSIAIKTNGTLWTWGYNNAGQLGDGTIVNGNAPIQIGSSSWSSSAAGDSFSMAIKADGTLWSWGRNTYGQLGDGTIVDKNTPIQITTATNWSSVTAGDLHSNSLKTDGSHWGWGWNTLGQLSDGTYIDKTTPTMSNCPVILDVTSFSNNSNVKVYPIPANEIITIEGNFKSEKITIQIFDISGKKLLDTEVQNSNSIQLPIDTLLTGYYMLSISDGTATVVKKIIVE